MLRYALVLVTLVAGAPAFADQKAEDCGFQADVVAAIQQARLDRVPEREVQDHILAQNPAWPDRFNNAIPLITPWIYERPRRVIRNEDLAAIWNDLCLQQ